MKPGLLDQIKSRGYWRVNFQPLTAEQRLSSLGECREVVERNVVELRGWDYPHFPRRIDDDSGLETGNEYYQAWIDWGGIKEFWRMYQSGQFIHYLTLREDWMAEDIWDTRQPQKPGQSLGIGRTTYQITEIFEFLSRLAKRGIYEDGVRVALSLHNTSQRALWLDAPGRVPLSIRYTTGAQKIVFNKQYVKDDLVSKAKDLAFDVIVMVFDRFQWHAPNKEAIRRDQEELLSKRL